jgi:uncharacterized delta-60 repeat protein
MKKSFSVRTIILAGSLLLQLNTLCFHSRGAAGDVDLSFDPGSGVNGPINAVAVQPDGKVIIGGQFTTVKGLVRTNLARLNADGSGDSSFDAGSLPPGYYNYQVYAVALQPDGKVLVGQDLGITRLNSDGSRDTNFNTGVIASASSIALQPDGKVILNGTTRLNSDGSLDTNFVSGADGYVYSMALQSDGKLIAVGYFYDAVNNTEGYGLLRLNTNGSLDSSFNAAAWHNQLFSSIVVQPDDKVLIGGSFIMVNGTNVGAIARLNANGSFDNSFNSITANGGVSSLAMQPDGKVLIGGWFTTVNGTNRHRIARLNANGSLDLSFNPGTGPDGGVHCIAVQPDGKVLIGGEFTTVNGTSRNRMARLHSDGSLDASFDPGRGVDSSLSSLVVQPDGKVLIAGTGFTTRVGIGRMNANGSPDGSFNPGTGVNSDVGSIALQPDGKILVVGSFTAVNGTNRLGLARLHADGGLDGSFNPCIPCLVPYDYDVPNGYYSTAVTAVLLQADGKILVAGYNVTFYAVEEGGAEIMRFFVVRFLADGNPDPAFTPFIGDLTDGGYWFYGWASYPVSALAVQSDGKIILSGYLYSVNDTNLTGVARLNANGTRDSSFTPGLGRYASVASLKLQPDGKLLAAGTFGIINGTNHSGIWRLQTNGSLDNTFNAVTGPSTTVSDFVSQPDGKIIIGGDFTTVNGTNRNRIARLDSNGSLDLGFNPGAGADGSVYAIALQPDGKVLIGGWFTTVNGVLRPHLARLYGDSRPSLNITRSNAAVIISWPSPSTGFTLQQNTNSVATANWSDVLTTPTDNGATKTVIVNLPTGNRLYRLKKP